MENSSSFKKYSRPHKVRNAADFAAFREHIQEIIDATLKVTNPTNKDPVDQLFKLKGLFDAGILSLDEFESKKKELLGEI